MTEADAQTLVMTCQEQSCLQKQLDQLRKQHRTHRSLMQEYQGKQSVSVATNSVRKNVALDLFHCYSVRVTETQ